MKIKSARILGVVMTLMLVSSLIVGIPLTASAGTQSWTAVAMPSAALTRLELAPVDITNVVVGGDGTIYAAAVDDVGAFWSAGSVVGDSRLLRSTNGGQTWAVVGGAAMAIVAPAQIVDIVPSPQTPTRVYVAVSSPGGVLNDVRVSANSGTTFITTYTIPAGTGDIISMDVSFKTSHIVAVGTDIGAAMTNVQTLDESVAFPIWTANGDIATTGAVLAIAFSPNFASDNMVMIVGDDATDHNVRQRVGAGAWGTIQTFTGAGIIAPAIPQPGAVIGFPSDFNNITNNVTFVGLNQTATDDLFMLVVGAAAPIDLNVGGAATVSAIDSLAVSGTSAAATLIVGVDGTAVPAAANVRRSTNAGTSWAAAAKQPTGGSAASGSLTFVALASDFATSGVVYAGTSDFAIGDGITDDLSAFSVALDGTSFNQRSLNDTDIATVDQLVPAGNDLFVVTSSAGVGPTALPISSLWRTSAATAGANWWRILPASDAGGGPVPAMVVGASSAYATDKVVWAATNNTGTGTITAMRSVNADTSATFAPSLSPITAASTGVVAVTGDANALNVVSTTSVLIGDVDGNVIRTTNNGIIWAGVTPGAGAITSLQLQGANVLVGDATGVVSLSANSGATFRALGATAALIGNTFAAFDPGFATNNLVYATSAGATVIDRVTVVGAGADVAATIAAAGVGIGSGIVAFAGPAAAATLYVSDATADTAPARSINPNAAAALVAFEPTGLNAAGAALPGAAATLGGLVGAVTASNTLWAIDTAVASSVLTFTDTLNIPATAGTAVATSPTTAAISWPAVANAATYAVVVAAPFGAAAPDVIIALGGAGLNAVIGTVVPMTTGAAYTFTVNVATPDLSYASAAAPMGTQPGPAPWNPSVGAVVIAPAAGGVGVSTTPTIQWNTTTGATGFELVVSKSSATTGNRLTTGDIADKTGANALVGNNATVYTITPALNNSTTYYWQVRAILGADFSPWTAVFAFTTAPAPAPVVTPTTTTTSVVVSIPAAPPATTITITQPPATTITIPPPPAQPTPAWVWAIIAIGGVLLVVVIVLIARTRKV